MSLAWAPLARIAAFAALAGFAVAHWGALVSGPPAGRLALTVGVLVVGAGLLELLAHAPLRRRTAWLLAALAGLAATAVAMAAIGIPLRLLWPGGWGELGANLDLGLEGLAGDVDYPYAEGNEWSRLAILAVAPLTLGVAATVAFWPAAADRARRRLRVAGLAIVIAVYVTAIAANPPDAPLLRGALLLALIAAWLWLPAIRWREGLVAAALVAAAGALAVPAAAQLSSDDPWLDYKSWVLRGVDGKTFRWQHSYGPIDWDRDGTRMLSVESNKALYWKTVVLDQFDGLRWTRSPDGAEGSRVLTEEVEEDLPSRNRDWIVQFTVTVAELESQVVVGSGTPLRLVGLDDADRAPDGTTVVGGEPLESGDQYRMHAYVPEPTADQMRNAPQSYPEGLARYTQLELPPDPERGPGEDSVVPSGLDVPLWGSPEDPDVERRLQGSAYERMYELAGDITDDQPTAYDAATEIQDHLRETYEYSELPPDRPLPLDSFLFEDRRGYCQQFSGTMALMLRMLGIPSRVVGGFAPGKPDDEGGRFLVEDFDAHSWVEVFFDDIGWVVFDPTPDAAPASSQEEVPGFPQPATEGGGGTDGQEADQSDEEAPAVGVPGAGGGGGSASVTSLLAIPATLLGLLTLGAALVGARAARHRRLEPTVAAEAQLGEVAAALDRLGWDAGRGATLLSLERRLRRSRRRAAAAYIGRIRALRYAAGGSRPPSLAERRAMRRELSSARGLGGRLRALVAIPPGGPRVPKRT